jgi:trehalose-phosphatase
MSEPPTSESHRVPNLLASWSSVSRRIAAAPRLALFLDFDGTLVNYAPRPEMVRLLPGTRHMLQRLAHNPRIRLAIISGRRRAEIVQHVGLPRLRYLGSYGWEDSARSTISGLDRAALAQAKRALKVVLNGSKSPWLEDKRFLLAVHFDRATPLARKRMMEMMRAISISSGGRLRIMENIEDSELLPRIFRDKGHAVSAELSRASARAVLPVYFGDNLSDEPAFAALRRGITVRVGRGKRTTRAHYQLRSPAEVADALAKIEEALR